MLFKRKTSFILLVVVIALAAYVYYDLSSEKNEKEIANKDLKIFSIKQDQISKLSFRKPEGNIELEKSIDGWKLIFPVLDDANSLGVENFLESFYKNTFSEKIDSVQVKDPQSLAPYGFSDGTNVVIEITDNSGASESLVISDLKNFESKHYAYRTSNPSLYLLEAGLNPSLQSSLQSFRVSKMFRGLASQLELIDFQFEKNKIKLIRKEDWEIDSSSGKSGKKLNLNKVREFISQLAGIEVSNYLSEGAPQVHDFTKYSIGKQVGSIFFKTTAKEYYYKIYQSSIKSSPDLFVLSSEPVFLLRLNPESKANLQKMSLDELVKENPNDSN